MWESAGRFQEFAESTIRPLNQEVGMSTEPTITIHEVDNSTTQG